MKLKLIPGLVACLALLFGTTWLAQAAPQAACSVPSNNYPTIEQALSKAKCTDITIAAGTYHEHDLHVGHDVIIHGAGSSSTIIDGDGAPILYVGYPTSAFSLSNVTLQHAATNGGALALDTDVSATVTNVTFKKNTIGLWMEGGTLQLSHSTFTGNNSLNTGAAIFRDGNGGDITIDSVKFKKNRASCAAAIYSATDSGTAQLTIFHSQFTKNKSNGPGCQGGAIHTADPTGISGSKFTSNIASMASSAGGAIYQIGSGMSIDSTTFSGNSAAQGGGIFSTGGINLTLTYNTFDHNVATVGNGGGLFSTTPTVIINTTFSANEAQGSGLGGGVAFVATSAYLGFVTFSDNTASSGGNLLVGDAELYLKSSLLNGGSPDNCYVGGSEFTSKGSNISSDASCATYLNQKGDRNATDPLLDVLANNGGDTKTHALLPGSPAINKSKNCLDAGGSVVLADQRGVHRPQGNKCDIGAYEREIQ